MENFDYFRFGEESLHSCEVMLKDVEDSKRTNNAVHSELLLDSKTKVQFTLTLIVPIRQ